MIHRYARKNEISFFSATEVLLSTDEFRPNVKKTLQKWLLKPEEIMWLSQTELAMKVFEESGYIEYWQNEVDG